MFYERLGRTKFLHNISNAAAAASSRKMHFWGKVWEGVKKVF